MTRDYGFKAAMGSGFYANTRCPLTTPLCRLLYDSSSSGRSIHSTQMKGSSVIAIVFLTSDARIGRDRKQMKSNFRAAILIGAAGLCSYVQLACHAQDAASYRANFAPLSQAADKQTTEIGRASC